ncbi:MAG: acyl-CoA synthetase FdrA [Elusimicrobiota bacterium]
MGVKKNIIKKDNYRDSVFLMHIASELEQRKDIISVSLMMGTPANKEVLENTGLLTDTGKTAGVNDLIIAVHAENETSIDTFLDELKSSLSRKPATGTSEVSRCRTLDNALNELPDATLALISVPGIFASREALKALDRGLNVMIFSDNVPIEEEAMLKRTASERGLLVMGPDCGTAIINGVPLGFANRIPHGDIGLSAASGTGLQEVIAAIAKTGSGITQAFGTGGRDLSCDIGGITMLSSLKYLIDDPKTKVIVLVSKPPDPAVSEKIIGKVRNCGKPVVICFIGQMSSLHEDNIYFTQTLESAGTTAAWLSQRQEPVPAVNHEDWPEGLLFNARERCLPPQKFIRGIYAGGTLCDEAIVILQNHGMEIYSNNAVSGAVLLINPHKSIKHTMIDMGADEFTRGRPHPMIDPESRNRRILAEAEDDETALILFDIVLGYGSHPDPAGALKKTLAKINSRKVLVASICGTTMDPQNYTRQSDILKQNGVILMPSNAQAAEFAAHVIRRTDA